MAHRFQTLTSNPQPPTLNPQPLHPDLAFQRPLVPLVVAYLSGLLLAHFFPMPLFFLLVLFGAALALAIFFWKKDRLLIVTGLSLLLFLTLGAARLTSSKGPFPPHHLSRLPEPFLEEGLILEGIVVAPPERQGSGREAKLRLILQVERILAFGQSDYVQGRARVSLLHASEEYHYGDRIRGIFKVRHPRGFLNPGGFDRRRFLAARGIFLEGWAEDDSSIRRLGRGEGNPLLFRIYQLRSHLLQALDRTLPPHRAAVLKALLLGDRSALTDEVKQAFLRSGTYHILAISGLHVGLLAGAFFFLLKLLRLPLRLSALLTIGFVTGYAALAGGRPSVVRAALMTDVYLLALLLEREADLLNTLALSAFLLLLWNPLLLFEVGFQLTFVATLSILLALDRIPLRWIPSPWRWPLAALLVSSAAFFGTLPILAFTFHRAAPAGLLANVFIVPLTGLVTPFGMAFGVLLLFFPQGFWPLDLVVGALIEALLFAARWFAAFPLASLTLYPPTPLMIVFYYLFFFSLLSWRLLWARWAAVLSLSALVVAIGLKLFPFFEGELRITFLDVGQGDAILLELPGKKTILIDGGGLPYGDFDIGKEVVAPYLRHRWIGHIDVVVLSHPHPDHLNGLQAIVTAFPVREIWEAGSPPWSALHLWLGEFARRRGIPHRIVEAGFASEAFLPVTLEVLHPSPPFLQGPFRRRASEVNNGSVVLKVNYKQVAILLTGDIEEGAEGELLKPGGDLKADILKVPHHGGRTSSSEAFLAAIRPKVAVVSVGVRNRFHHPHPEALARYRAIGAHLFRTDQDGAVLIKTDGHRIFVKTFHESRWTQIE